jgi:hypothetical protein
MGLIKFFKELFGGKKAEDCGCDTPGSCPTPEVCEVEVPAVEVVETKVEVPTVEVVETKEVPVVKTEEPKKQVRRRSKAKTEKKEVEVISEKLAEVATEKKVTAKDIKGKKKSEFPIAPVAEVTPEKKSKPRRRRKPKPKTDEGQA